MVGCSDHKQRKLDPHRCYGKEAPEVLKNRMRGRIDPD
jgi:hypothetical protein